MAITFIEARPITPLKMGKEVCERIKEASIHSKKPGPKSFPNMQMRVK
jgi:hypothetical protein